MSLADSVATHSANKYISSFCQDMEHQEKLLTWQQVYSSTLRALKEYDALLREQRQDARAQASLN